MANSELAGKNFEIPEDINKHLKKIFNAYKGAKNAEGYQRLEGLIDKKDISYEQLKLIKNFFDNYSGERKSTTYLLNGGTLMKNWVNKTLTHARDGIKNIDNTMSDVGMPDKLNTKDLKVSRVNTQSRDSETNKILRQEGIYNMRLMENLITTINKNKRLCLDQHN